MGKLLLGIIAVICLDLGFVAFMADDRTQESARMVVENVQETDLASDPMVAPASLSVYDEPAVLPAAAPVPERIVYVPVVVVRHVRSSPLTLTASKAKHRDLAPESERTDPKVIEARYVESAPKKNAEMSEAAQRDLIYELATMKNRRSEKRSFVASSVVPVVKKPWDLLKAVGDKLK